jgi:predicted transcriptional regulator
MTYESQAARATIQAAKDVIRLAIRDGIEADPWRLDMIVDGIMTAILGEFAARFEDRLAALESRADAEDTHRAEQHERG